MSRAKITSKGQITIPVKVRTAMGVVPGDRLEFVEQDKGRFVIIPATRSIRELKGMLRVKRARPVTIEEINAAIAKAAAESR
ncbi:MAG TPA: AbrB/MazE/SpoVT family DNA-binding domain-containing protein [Candidatus Aquilonibacter sp.]|nr:AbrB/MazE/SpoVT family DNA-binding domain-containing protein [Candidatus Aquilonibacter sp.]